MFNHKPLLMNYKIAFYITTLLIIALCYVGVVMFIMKWYLVVFLTAILTMLFLWCWFVLIDEIIKTKQR